MATFPIYRISPFAYGVDISYRSFEREEEDFCTTVEVWTKIEVPEGSRLERRPVEGPVEGEEELVLVLPDGAALDVDEAFERFADPTRVPPRAR